MEDASLPASFFGLAFSVQSVRSVFVGIHILLVLARAAVAVQFMAARLRYQQV
jgi:hypothetical protein